MMKRISAYLLLAMTILLSACGQPQKKSLVVYFSATGVTKAAAGQIAQATGADLMEIVPAQLYTAEDLDWRIPDSRNQVEEHDRSCRPAIQPMDIDWALYDTVYIGYPIWASEAPRVINTFVESADLSGKVLKPFCTSGMTPVEPSVEALRTSYPTLNWQDGLRMNEVDEATLNRFIGKE